EELRDSRIQVGAQDCWTERSGAFTGAVSPAMLAEVCTHVIVGHSERRRVFGENDELVARKAKAGAACGLVPIVCVGEDLAVRESGQAETFVSDQLRASLASLLPHELAKSVLAYEPIW